MSSFQPKPSYKTRWKRRGITVSPTHKARTPATTPTAPSAYPAKVGRAAAPVLAAVEAAAEAEDPDEAAALVLPLAASVVPFAFPALERADAVTPVLFWQLALYCSVESEACVNVMSAHYSGSSVSF